MPLRFGISAILLSNDEQFPFFISSMDTSASLKPDLIALSF